MSKELDEFEEMYNWIYCNCGTTYEDDVKLDRIRTNVKRALQRLEAIDKKRCGANVEKIIIDEFVPSNELDNAKPSEALNCIEKVNDYLKNVYDYKEIIEEVQRDINTIKQALNKAQEQEKVLEIIFEKGVEMALFNDSKTVEDYNRNRNWGAKELTQEEFDTLKRWIENENNY